MRDVWRRSLGVAILGGGGAVASAALLSSPTSCTTHQCDPSTLSLDAAIALVTENSSSDSCSQAEAGGALSAPSFTQNGAELIWESSPLQGTWFCFPANGTVQFTLPPQFSAAQITDIVTYVGTSGQPTTTDAETFTVASGNLAEVEDLASSDAGTVSFSVLNSTCQQYWAHVTVRAVLPVASNDAGI